MSSGRAPSNDTRRILHDEGVKQGREIAQRMKPMLGEGRDAYAKRVMREAYEHDAFDSRSVAYARRSFSPQHHKDLADDFFAGLHRGIQEGANRRLTWSDTVSNPRKKRSVKKNPGKGFDWNDLLPAVIVGGVGLGAFLAWKLWQARQGVMGWEIPSPPVTEINPNTASQSPHYAVLRDSFHLRPIQTVSSVGPEIAARTRVELVQETPNRRGRSTMWRVRLADGRVGFAYVLPEEIVS